MIRQWPTIVVYAETDCGHKLWKEERRFLPKTILFYEITRCNPLRIVHSPISTPLDPARLIQPGSYGVDWSTRKSHVEYVNYFNRTNRYLMSCVRSEIESDPSFKLILLSETAPKGRGVKVK